jgi:hypothetical protein
MLNIELTWYGLDDTLKELIDALESALGNDNSKRRKDEMIYKALGYTNAVLNMVRVVESDENNECESE